MVTNVAGLKKLFYLCKVNEKWVFLPQKQLMSQ